MYQLGVRAHDYGAKTPQDLFAVIAADGWQTLQLAPRKALAGVQTLADVTPACLNAIHSAIQATGVTVGVLGAYVELSLADDAGRVACVDDFVANLSLAKALDASCVASETTPMALQPNVTRAQALRCLRRSLETILPEAQRLGVRVAIEPVHTHALATPELAQALLRDLQSPNLYILFDPVNLLSLEELSQQHSLWQRAMDAFGDRIAAVHLKAATVRDGQLVREPSFANSVIDYQFLFTLLTALPSLAQAGYDIPLLREEATPAQAVQDIAFLRALL